MAGNPTERGQIVAVEVLLLLAVLVIALGMYQAFGVPDQNRDTEFEHNLDVQSDLIDYRNSLVDVRGADQANRWHQSVQIRLGTSYSSRIVGINPPNPSGTLLTHSSGDIEIDNAEVDGWFHGDPQGNLLEQSHETLLLTYEPNYNEYHNPPRTAFEHSLVYNIFETGHGPISKQRLINGDDRMLNILLFAGELAHSGQRVTLDPKTLDGPTATVPIEPTNGTITMTIPSMTPAIWESLIGSTYDTGETNARVVDTGVDQVTIELIGEWELEMAKVGFDGGQTESMLSAIQPYDPADIPLLSFVDGSEGTSGNDLFFEVENEALEAATITAVGVDTDLAASYNRPADTPEISIISDTQSGYVDTGGGGGQALTADGTLYDLTPEAIIDMDQTGSVDIGDFEGGGFGGFESVTRTESAEAADLTVYFEAEERDDLLTFHFIVDEEPSFFEVTIIDTNEPVIEGETLTVTAEIENLGELSDTQDIELLDFDGNVVDTEAAVTIPGGDSELVEMDWETEVGDAATGEITVQSGDDSDTRTVTIYEEGATVPAFFDVTITGTNAPITEGQTLTVTAEIENTGDESATQDIELDDFEGNIVDTYEDLTLGPGDSATVSLDWDTVVGDAGTGTVTVSSIDDADTAEVTIDEIDQAPPTIDSLDAQSQGHGQHARFNVQFAATAGDSGITQAQLELVNTNTGNVVDTWTATYAQVSSVSESINRALEQNQGAGTTYSIRLTITDANGLSVQDEITRVG